MLRPACTGGEWPIQLELQGDVDASFAPVADAFLEGFNLGRDVGAALAVFVEGQPVVDVWAGHRDRRRTELWVRDTLCCLFSATKGPTALCVLQAVAEGVLELDDPIARHWPAFASHGKEAITTRQVLSHQSGIVGFHEPVDAELLYDSTAYCALLEQESHWWTPGTRHGYQARSFGYLLDELMRRVSGAGVADWLDSRICTPHDLDLQIGLTPEQMSRCAQLVPARVKAGHNSVPPQAEKMMARLHDLATPTGSAFQNPSLGPGYMNSERFRSSQMPAMNGHGTARGLARLYSLLPTLLPKALLQEAGTVHSTGFDEVLQAPSQFGLGFMLHHPDAPIGVAAGTLGHAGAGGSMAFYDPGREIGYCFVMNQMQQGVVTGGDSATSCAKAVYRCL